jgi:hypothetical protein
MNWHDDVLVDVIEQQRNPTNSSVTSLSLFDFMLGRGKTPTKINLPSSPTLANLYPLPSPRPGSKAIEVTKAECP